MNTLKTLSAHEKEVVLNAVEKIIEKEGPIYVRPLYQILKRENNIDLFGENITDLLNGDPRFTLKGWSKELIDLVKKPEKEQRSITSVLMSIKDYIENPDSYSWDDIEFLCNKLKKNGFTEKSITQEMKNVYKNEILSKLE
jgi:predicted ATPase with chaperone activity